ncbi:uncharacterized protein V6R79_012057 [Siganus canaliculatus]
MVPCCHGVAMGTPGVTGPDEVPVLLRSGPVHMYRWQSDLTTSCLIDCTGHRAETQDQDSDCMTSWYRTRASQGGDPDPDPGSRSSPCVHGEGPDSQSGLLAAGLLVSWGHRADQRVQEVALQQNGEGGREGGRGGREAVHLDVFLPAQSCGSQTLVEAERMRVHTLWIRVCPVKNRAFSSATAPPSLPSLCPVSGAPAQIRSERIPSIFTRFNFSSVRRSASAPLAPHPPPNHPPTSFDSCGFLSTGSGAVFSFLTDEQAARCQAPLARNRSCCQRTRLLSSSETEPRSRSADRRTCDQFVDFAKLDQRIHNTTGGRFLSGPATPSEHVQTTRCFGEKTG